MKPVLSFVFCTNSRAHLRDFAHGLLDLQRHIPNLSCELVVVNPGVAGLNEELRPIQARGISTRKVYSPWGNRNASRNLGFAEARGDWLYYLDQDVRLHRRNLEPLIRRLNGLAGLEQNVCLLGGRYLTPPNWSFWGHSYNWLSNLWVENPAHGGRVLAGNVLMRKSFFLEPPFNEELCEGGEEIDLCDQVLKNGGSIRLSGDLDALHLVEHDFKMLCSRLFQHKQAKRKLVCATKSTRLSWGMIAALREFPLGVVPLIALAVASGVNRFAYMYSRRIAQ